MTSTGKVGSHCAALNIPETGGTAPQVATKATTAQPFEIGQVFVINTTAANTAAGS